MLQNFKNLFSGKPSPAASTKAPHTADQTLPEVRGITIPDGNGEELHWIIRDGEPWFFADSACRAIEIVNHRLAISSIHKDDKGVCDAYTPGGIQSKLIVNESGLYALIFKSRKPEALTFQRWVTSAVLPSIRKTGSYALPTAKKAGRPRKEITNRDVIRQQISDLHAREKTRIMSIGVGVRGWGEYCSRFFRALGFAGGSKQVQAELKTTGTPWDKMSEVVLATAWSAKAVVARKVAEEEKAGIPMPFHAQCDLVSDVVARQFDIVTRELNGRVGVATDDKDGMILDIIRN
jgi:prophage antirepressor-like protein